MRQIQFNEVKVVVNCQYFENYAWETGGEHWKPKGRHQFAFIVDSDEWCYCSDVVKSQVERVVANKCDYYQRFVVVGYEVVFEEDEDITDEVAMLCKEEYNRLNEEALLKALP